MERKSTTKTTNGTIKINLIKSKCETSAQKPSQTISASLGSNKSAQKLTGSDMKQAQWKQVKATCAFLDTCP